MHFKHLILLSFLLLSLSSIKADEFTLKGSVRDRVTSSYIMMAKIECLNEQDSVVGEAWAVSHEYDYRRHVSVEKAIFWMEIPRVKGNYTLRFTHEEYDTITAPLDLTDIGRREYDRETGTFYMDRPKVHKLKDLEVTASKILFYNRGDTIVYNADAFQLAEGSMLDALIEQLPGVGLREGGQIYVNGKFVKSLLLNGKDFFKGDNRLMLDNLAAYTVKNIEVYKKQTERARFLNLDNEENKELVMDVKLKKEYIGGWSINTEVAGGTEDRYLARLFAMNFRALSQLTLIGNANNLNDDTRPTAEDQWDPDDMAEGEMRHHEAGFDYSVENEDGSRKGSGNLVYRNNRNQSQQMTNITTFLPGTNTYGTSNIDGVDRSFEIGTRHTLYMQTKDVAVKLNPQVSWSRGHDRSESQSVASRDPEHAELINATMNRTFGGNESFSIGTEMNTTLKIPKTSDAIDIFGNVSYRDFNNHSESYYVLKYGDSALSPVGRRQYSDNSPTHNFNYGFGAAYNLIFSNRLQANLTYGYSASSATESTSFYMGQLDAGYTGDYTMENLYDIKMAYDPTNSNTSDSRERKHYVRARMSWEPNDHWRFSSSVPLCFYNNSLHMRQDEKDYDKDYRKTLVDDFGVTAEYSWYKDDGGSLSFNLDYSRQYRLPRLENMITLPNTRDPLSQYLGNPDLQPTLYNRYSVMLQRSTRSNFMTYLYTYFQDSRDAMISSYTYDMNSGRRTYKTINVDGNWNIYGSLYTSWFWTKYNWNFSLSLNYSQYRTHNVIGTDSGEFQRVAMNSVNFSPRLRISKFFGSGRGKGIELSFTPDYIHNKSTDINANNINPFDGQLKLSGKCDFPYGWSISTSLDLHMRSGYNDPRMDRNELIWNGRISKSFLKGNLLASFVAYDLLHQHQCYRYYVSPQAQIETFTNTIPRYMLIDLQYRINIQPKKKIAQTTHHY